MYAISIRKRGFRQVGIQKSFVPKMSSLPNFHSYSAFIILKYIIFKK